MTQIQQSGPALPPNRETSYRAHVHIRVLGAVEVVRDTGDPLIDGLWGYEPTPVSPAPSGRAFLPDRAYEQSCSR